MKRPTRAVVASLLIPALLAFSPPVPYDRRIGRGAAAVPRSAACRLPSPPATSLWLSSKEEAAPPTVHPGLSRAEIEFFLFSVPVYGIASEENGSMLLFEEGGGKNVAEFYVSREMAESTLGRLEGGGAAAARVEGYYLGLIWNSLLFPPVTSELFPAKSEEPKLGDDDNSVQVLSANGADVEYRLIPDSREVEQARELYLQSRGGTPDEEGDLPFGGLNEVPVFMDLNLRLATEGENEGEYDETFPMYLSYRDLVSTCQDYAKEEGGEIRAAISVGDLASLLKQMETESAVDFREASLIPPSPLPFQ